MRSFLTLLLLCCLSVTIGVAQQRSTTKKPGTATRKPSTPVRKPVTTRPTPVTQPAVEVTSSQPASLTFPSTEPDTEPMDPVKKQQMYDELHGVKAKTAEPQGKGDAKGKTAKDSRRAKAEDMSRMPSASQAAGSEASTYIGVKVGGNYLTLLDVPVSVDPVYGFHGGLVFQFGNGKVAFQPEVLYNNLSSNGVSTSFLQLPLLAKFQFGQQGNTRFFVNVGPYGQYSIDNNADSVIDYGGALGLGAGIPLGAGKLTIEARGYYALGSTQKGIEFGNYPFKPLLGQLSIGYLFPLGGR
ncbi:porin family protein [Fibrella sp. WM1]|uniref:porin family protein n=1 Tax=Fibrella musci TaxID=3242485 RepID=UPI0035218810